MEPELQTWVVSEALFVGNPRLAQLVPSDGAQLENDLQIHPGCLPNLNQLTELPMEILPQSSQSRLASLQVINPRSILFEDGFLVGQITLYGRSSMVPVPRDVLRNAHGIMAQTERTLEQSRTAPGVFFIEKKEASWGPKTEPFPYFLHPLIDRVFHSKSKLELFQHHSRIQLQWMGGPQCEGVLLTIQSLEQVPTPRFLKLSLTQRRIAYLATKGRSNKEIASALGRSPETIKSHLSQIYTFLGITNRAELSRYEGETMHGINGFLRSYSSERSYEPTS